jgi:hydrogenase-4 component E
VSDALFTQLLDLAVGLVLVCAFIPLWRRGLVAVVRALAVQGGAVAAVALLLGVHRSTPELVAVALLVFALKALVIPALLLRIVAGTPGARDSDPLVNVPASLLAGAALTLLAYAATRHVVALDPAPEVQAVPVGFAVVLVGFFVLVSRRKAVSQVVGFLILDNGIALVAFLATAGLPLVVELGASLDLLLAVLVLQVLAARMRTKFGGMDLDQLQELSD